MRVCGFACSVVQSKPSGHEEWCFPSISAALFYFLPCQFWMRIIHEQTLWLNLTLSYERQCICWQIEKKQKTTTTTCPTHLRCIGTELTWEWAPSARCYTWTLSSPPWCSWSRRPCPCPCPCPRSSRRAGPWGSSGLAEPRTSAGRRGLRTRRGSKRSNEDVFLGDALPPSCFLFNKTNTLFNNNILERSTINIQYRSTTVYSHSNTHLSYFT